MSKSVRLIKLEIQNFKGLRHFKADFSTKSQIRGFNEAGKSTVYDGFCWLCFGKNAADEKDFSIKNTVDRSLNRMDHRVKATIETDGTATELERVYKETWTKKRGDETETFTGHTTEFFVNNVPMDQKGYVAKIAEIMSEETFKLLTNIYYFPNLEWQPMRSILTKMASIRTDEEIASGREDFTQLIRFLSGKNEVEFKKELAAKLKKAKEEHEKIPIQIQEASTAKKPVDKSITQDTVNIIKAKINALQSKKTDINESHKPIFEKIKDENNQLIALERKLSEAQDRRKNSGGSQAAKAKAQVDTKREEAKGDLMLVEHRLQNKKYELSNIQENISSKKEGIVAKGKEKESLLAQYMDLKKSTPTTISAEDCVCPTCKRAFEPTQVEQKTKEIVDLWNQERSNKMSDIDKKGNALRAEIIILEGELKQLEGKVSTLETEIKTIEADVKIKKSLLDSIIDPPTEATDTTATPSKEEIDLKAQIDNFIKTPPPVIDYTQIDLEIKELQEKNDEAITALSVSDSNKKQDERVTELKNKEKVLAKEIASIEKTQFVMAAFTKAKMDDVEKSVNEMFQNTTFSLYKAQINEGEKETCIPHYKGVPYASLNFAGKINCGLDIVNTMIKHHDIKAPVFIDNVESVTEFQIELDPDIQTIYLVADRSVEKGQIIFENL